MNSFVHRFFVFLLLSIGLLSIIVIMARNAEYYMLPDEERPFHPRYDQLKPSGNESHGYGIIGSAMIIIGVVTYSSRKRIRAFNQIGKIKYFLEFHIFLCLFGPLLIMYHTTFKFGGIVAVSFWSMAAVAMSGIVGRYLYVQIPKGIQGNELDIKELELSNDELKRQLMEQFGLDEIDIKKIDALAASQSQQSDSLISLLLFFIIGDITVRHRVKKIIHHLHGHEVDPSMAAKVVAVAGERIKLLRRIQFLEKLKYYFHYWHVIHLPFSMIMFIILFVHVGVAIAFGYTWVF
ncbi:MAG: hypothetical protein M0R68_12895 [Bacteroidetes bacterium]|nr:hypothetical protein [Bacteroidota bacterium]